MELTAQEQGVLDHLELLLRRGESLPEASHTLKVMTGDPGLVDRVVAERERIAEERRHIVVDAAITDLEDVVPWYTGPRATDLFWPALQQKLQADPDWADAVDSLDESSTEVVGLLANPHSPTISTRGLVVGYVQSGKTANFTATIAKAADAGYRLFIVLSGVHNALRRQTQWRLDEHLYELHKTKWLPLTDESQDFGNPVKALPLVAATDLCLLAVVKKNVSRLTRLRDWLLQADKDRGLDACPVLIIDDESDQASPNAAKDPELNRTAINKLIVELLKLPRVGYIGYTATPFANVLINPKDVGDMYPRNFIYALPKPPPYFGSEELFGSPVSEDEEREEDDPHDMIRTVPEEEASLYRVSSKVPWTPVVTPSLEDAIRWFVIATAARRVRSGKSKHSSMLIHTTNRVIAQIEHVDLIKEYVKDLRARWDAGQDVDAWSNQWIDEQQKEPPARAGYVPMAFEDLTSAIPEVLAEIKVVADNSGSTDRLIYTSEPATVIAVGGNTLSRGLTLEGLISSYFLRTAQTYDSLLQMGRWFGYRPGFEDLPRIWTTTDLANDFRFLSEIERDMRHEISKIQAEGATPAQLPVRLRLHPRMQITAKNKMHFAVQGEASYSGQRPQTTYFHHRNEAEISNNRAAARTLIQESLAAGAQEERQESRVVLRGVSPELVIAFINRFLFHPDTELRSDLLTSYIDSQRQFGWLENWNLAIISRRPPAETIKLGLEDDVYLITRSKLKNSSTETTANIGTLMSKPDRVADLMESAVATRRDESELLAARTNDRSGLVLLYPIDKNSTPKDRRKDQAIFRIPLDAVDHLVGAAFSFPSAAPETAARDYVQVELPIIGPSEEVESDETYEDSEGSRDDVDLTDA